MSMRPPFMEILTRGLRYGAYAGLAVYCYGILTDNPSLYTSKPGDPLDETIDLENLSYKQVRYIYEKHLEKRRGESQVNSRID